MRSGVGARSSRPGAGTRDSGFRVMGGAGRRGLSAGFGGWRCPSPSAAHGCAPRQQQREPLPRRDTAPPPRGTGSSWSFIIGILAAVTGGTRAVYAPLKFSFPVDKHEHKVETMNTEVYCQ